MKALITGGTGLLGSHLIQGCPKGLHLASVQRNPAARGTFPGIVEFQADLSDVSQLSAILNQWEPDLVIHTAGEGSVDAVQINPELGRRYIFDLTRHVALACSERTIPLIYLSSNAVFSGEGAPYSEDANRTPRNVYGQLKVLTEDLVLEASDNNLVCRPILSFGWPIAGQRENPVTWLINELKEKRPAKIVEDVWENPISADSVAQGIWALIQIRASGVFNLGGAERLSRFEFAQRTVEVFDLDKDLIEPVSSSFFKGLAPRPRDTTLQTDKLQQMTNWRPRSVRDDLVAMRTSRRT